MAKTLTGIVSSNAANKTIVITVRTRKTHPIYKKQYTVTSKFMAHDEKNECQVGDSVIIIETKPLSARKRFTLQEIVSRAAISKDDLDVLKKESTTEVTEEKPKPSAKVAKATKKPKATETKEVKE